MKAGNYFIRWQHSDEIGILPTSNPLKKKIVRRHNRTYCSLYGIDGNLIQTGHSLCAKGDIFNKSIGRKVSLARALKNANLPKEERKEIWEAYRNSTNPPRW